MAPIPTWTTTAAVVKMDRVVADEGEELEDDVYAHWVMVPFKRVHPSISIDENMSDIMRHMTDAAYFIWECYGSAPFYDDDDRF